MKHKEWVNVHNCPDFASPRVNVHNGHDFGHPLGLMHIRAIPHFTPDITK